VLALPVLGADAPAGLRAVADAGFGPVLPELPVLHDAGVDLERVDGDGAEQRQHRLLAGRDRTWITSSRSAVVGFASTAQQEVAGVVGVVVFGLDAATDLVRVISNP
jgi:hypothetical protein